MYANQPKKMLILNILDILKIHTDESHTLNLTDIINKLESDYYMKADRKAVKRNIDDLIDAGFNIEYKETPRKTTNPATNTAEDTTIRSDYYLEHDFTDSELRLLVDSLLFSTHLPYNQCRDLVEKLERLSSKYFHTRIRHIHTMPNLRPHNDQIFLNVDLIDEAIENKMQIAFNYCKYHVDKKMHKKLNEKGEETKYIINPYQMVAKDGNYYLICNREGYTNLSNYRIDRIADMSILNKSCLKKTLKGLLLMISLYFHHQASLAGSAWRSTFSEFLNSRYPRSSSRFPMVIACSRKNARFSCQVPLLNTLCGSRTAHDDQCTLPVLSVFLRRTAFQ